MGNYQQRRVVGTLYFQTMRLPLLFDCPESWASMSGSQRQRHCATCDRDVHNLSALRKVEAQALLLLFQSQGLCVRYATDAEGQILHAKEARPAPVLQRLAAHGQLGAGMVALTLASGAGCAPAAGLMVKPQAGLVAGTGAASSAPPAPAAAGAGAAPLGVVDQDGDGVPDAVDKCPYEPGQAEHEGCPHKTGYVQVIRGPLEILDKFYFDYGKSKLKPFVHPLLDEVAALLIAHPEITRLQVAGHTSADEPRAHQLGEDRAQAVIAALVAKRVERSRLLPYSYGNERPAYDNKTLDDRVKNRRVEFVILERASCPAPEVRQ